MCCFLAAFFGCLGVLLGCFECVVWVFSRFYLLWCGCVLHNGVIASNPF